ncbi:enoyl-CoA-hydratase DpgB [Micromonospora sp. NPDC048935]|uniref:enoyl-CoA-hydratase DpgB n=1 Tax=Micromonospora sp. NPDC048935 TaxID=3364262 RepID=UPI00371F3308
MQTESELSRLMPDGLGLALEINGTRPLRELTAGLNAACDRVEGSAQRSVLLLRLLPTPTDSRSWPGAVGIQDITRWERAVRRLERLSAMSIAVAAGACGGPALDLLLATDFRIGEPNLLLMLPVNDGHFWPGMAVYRLTQQLGAAKARQIVLWGDDLDIDRARGLGLIDQIATDLSEAAHTATVLMGRISDRELAIRRQLLLEASSVEFSDALGAHLAACDRELRRLAFATADKEDAS